MPRATPLPPRRMSRTVTAGAVPIGGGGPVVVQSMVKVDPHDPEAIAREADALAELGCALVRLAIPDRRAAEAIAEVRARSRATLVADVHFDPRLALAAIDAGAHKVRVNPGNLRGGEDAIREIARAAKGKGVPIRVGANSGSLPEGLDGLQTGEALARAVLEEARAFERAGFEDLVLSAKGSDCVSTVVAGRALARETDYPLHVGVTAAGPPSLAWAKSAGGIGALLVDGIGDTIRVSYTGDPREEVRAAFAILDAFGLGPPGPQIVSCPTCGRTRVDLVGAVEQVRDALSGVTSCVRVAVMGCEVNGPGEARDADVGLACGKGGGWLFAKGERIRRVNESEMVRALVDLALSAAREPEGAAS
ncbi:MAG: flavodoxin-dependent (E)-4-hydroxy-3-methylbut-2-enyl-diphosphate synthase [Planctomycetota bacterium]